MNKPKNTLTPTVKKTRSRSVSFSETAPPSADLPQRSLLDLIREIQSGARSPRSLSMEDRQRCIEHLEAEGCTVAEMGHILKVNERTIFRDRLAIRESNALRMTPTFVGETVGAFVRKSELSTARLLKLLRAGEATVVAKIEAERAIWQINMDVVRTLQSLGYLPNATHHVNATVALAQQPSLQDMAQELARLTAILGVDAASLPTDQTLAPIMGAILRAVPVLHEVDATVAPGGAP